MNILLPAMQAAVSNQQVLCAEVSVLRALARLPDRFVAVNGIGQEQTRTCWQPPEAKDS